MAVRRARSGSTPTTLNVDAPSAAPASSAGIQSSGPVSGRICRNSTSRTVRPVSDSRSSVSRDIGEPGAIGYWCSPSVTALTRTPTKS